MTLSKGGSATAPGTVTWDDGLRALVRLSGALALGSRAELVPLLEEVGRRAAPEAVEEALLQSYLFLGFPTALNAFAAWREVSGRAAPAEAEAEGTVPAWAARGEETCRAVYGGAFDALRENVGRMKPEMERWMRVEGYGKVLGRPGLDLCRRECCIVAILAVQDVPVQLRSHLRGALRCGVDPSVVERVLEEVADIQDDAARASARATWALVRDSAGPAGSGREGER